MSLVTLKEVLEEAKQKNYAVAAFDAVDHASAEGIIAAAEMSGRPAILMVPEAGLPLIDVDAYFDFLVWRIQRASVPIALELDHGKSLDVLKRAIAHGFTGVMIDGSELPYEENVKLTRQVVELAHAKNVSVEAEIGHVAGGEGNMSEGSEVDESMYTTPEDARNFVAATGVDALAVAFGTVHGVYKGTPKLDLDRLCAIKKVVDVPLVMHGGSGISREDFVRAVECGINKINLFTEVSLAAVEQSTAYAGKKNNKLHFAEMVLVGRKTVEKLAADYLQLFGQGK